MKVTYLIVFICPECNETHVLHEENRDNALTYSSLLELLGCECVDIIEVQEIRIPC